jgi:DNA-directed RNA polymerase specialized sigma24 family protein
MKKSQNEKAHAVELLLDQLHRDREIAQREYDALRKRLIKIIQARPRPGSAAEDLADEAIDRVAARIATGERIKDVNAYATIVARNLINELFSQPPVDQIDDKHIRTLINPPEDPIEKEIEQGCYKECLAKLNGEEHKLLKDYYSHDGRGLHNKVHRESVALKYGKNLASLRVIISRLQKGLRDCKKGCMEREKNKLL